MKLITFTVPCYNSAAYMEKCLESLMLGGEDVEIIIINDGSKDDTGAIADRWAAAHPTIVRVVHQENGGHGEGINQGLAHATGKYFKVVDSDDWLDREAYAAVLDKLWALEQTGGVDLLVANYVYTHEEPKDNSTIAYRNVFPVGEVCTWQDTNRFGASQYLTLHSCIYRTDIIRQSGMVLPKHVFYEDNLFAYTPLPLTKKLCYLDVDLYCYLIGREGQSVQEATMVKRSAHQVLVSTRIFDAHDLRKVKAQNPKLGKYMYHEVVFMMTIATVFTRMNFTDEAERQVKDMWAHVYQTDRATARRVRWGSIAFFVNLPGKAGRWVSCKLYRIVRHFVHFN